ncbi:restriction endonuclease subunit S [Vibrio fluvialis]|nr:restriction endonuclease subunit S [Vibrio fluvialis]
MSELPKGWESKNLLDLCDVKTGKVDANHASPDGNYTFFTCALEPMRANTYTFEGDLIILPGNGANVGHVGFFRGKIEAYQRTYVLYNVHIDSKFLYYHLKFYWKKRNEEKQYGSATNYIKMGNFKEYVVAFPPLPEQKRIVEKLDEVLAQVDTIKARLDGIPELLKRFRQSVLASAVSGKLTEEWREEVPSSVEALALPKGWQIKAAKEVCIKVQSGSTPRNDPFNQDGTVPFLKVYNIVNQKIDFDYKPQFVTSETHRDKLKRSIACPGDVLMNIVGPPLGKVAILTDQYPEWNLNQAITLFRANDDLLLNKYLYFVLCEGALVRDVMPETKGSVGQVNISLTQCRESNVPLPPIEEQKEIVRLVEQYFSFADTIEAQVKKAQARVDNLTQSILAKAFRGELVPQNEDDELAEVLLERIAKARKEAEALAKVAKKAGKQSIKNNK